MKQIEYNLLEERWVRVRGQDYTVQEVSLPDALLHAHEYRDLAGELPTQDAAMLRLLLAVLHTVFSRVDENGTPAPFEETDDDSTILQSGPWKRQHSMKRLPEAETKKRVSVPAEGGSGFRSSLTRGPLWRCGSLRQKVLTERWLFAIII